RQALNYAVDRSAIAKVIGGGYGMPSAQMAVPGDDGFDAILNRRYPYDPTKAKQLLTAAGYPNGFTLSTLVYAGNDEDTLAQALAGQFAKIGVKLKLNDVTDAGVYGTDMQGGKFPAVTLDWGRLPSAINYQLLWGPKAGQFNPFKSTDPTLTALNNQLVAAPAADASQIAQKMQARLVDLAWFVPVLATPLV